MEHPPLAEQVAKWVRDNAKAAGVSDRSLAEGASIPRPTLLRSLYGPRPLTLPEFERLARSLGHDPLAAVIEAVA